MSSDNGIYILETTNQTQIEYRVIHGQAIDNLNFGADIIGEEYNAAQVVAYFKKSKIFTDKGEAFKYACKLHDDYGYTEYGICTIKSDKLFSR